MLSDQNNYTAVEREAADAHWKDNALLVGLLLVVWFIVTWVASVFADGLNRIHILGFPLGYVTGSMLALFIYTIMIFYYAYRMDQIDEKHGMKE